MAGLNGPGLVGSFHLYLLPSAIFGGYVIGRTLRLPPWGKVVLTCACAAGLASMLPYA